MLFKVISDTDICYAIVIFVIYSTIIIIFFCVILCHFFSLCLFTGGLLLEDLGHSQSPGEKFILFFFNVVCNLLVNKVFID